MVDLASPAGVRTAASSEPWHLLSASSALERLGSSDRGLSEAEARQRLIRWGPNVLQQPARAPAWHLLLRQFTDVMILALVVAAIVAATLGEVADSLSIVAIVALNGILGFTQELRAERALEALADMAAPSADVRRDGTRTTIPARELVPGDLVYVEAGSIVPADLRLLETHALRADEASLTGESEPVDKMSDPVEGRHVSLGDRRNLAYAGTLITYGRATGLAVATGAQTEFGRIAGMLASAIETETPLSKRLRRFGVRLASGILVLCALLFATGMLRGEAPLLMFMTAVSLAVAAIPEALPAVVTINLALGAHKMARRRAVVRRLSAVEALGSVTHICTDKTGTLTLNRMRVEKLWTGDVGSDEPPTGPAVDALLRALVLCNDARPGAAGKVIGDPTERALVEAARTRGLEADELDDAYPRVAELPFDSARMCMSTVHPDPDGGFLVTTKGAVEAIARRCDRIRTATGEVRLDADDALRAAETMARDGLRVLAVAERHLDVLPDPQHLDRIEHDLVLLGLVGLLDPPREEAYRAVRECREAGITPVMITGDHPGTATAIARRLGILSEDEVAVLADDATARAHAYARVAPEQKLTIVRALQSDGEIVAMTGDGVNDAPALRQADVGVAMGITGTDVAKQASSIVVLDDDFATIVSAVREGRRIYDNIRRFIRYALTTNTGEVLTVALAPLFGLPIPLLPAQILFINLLTDGLPGVALAAEPPERNVMRRAPYPPSEGLLSRGLGFDVVWVGILIATIALSIQVWALSTGIESWQTMVFVALTSAQLWNVMAIRSDTDSLFALGLRSNLPLLGAVALTTIALLAAVYVPVLNRMMHTRPLTPGELALALFVPALVFVAVESQKRYRTIQARNRSKPAQNLSRISSVS